ncbi:MAG: DUF362 domain-containing protein [Thermodesulfobacteriota bacterium]|nr:DUF362 domain-containing protein [Thermodesulfobacteriota bacterium]
MNDMDNAQNPQVVIVRCKGYEQENVYQKVKESIDMLGGMERFVKGGDRVLLKPNLLSAKPKEKAVTTHPSFISAVARLVQEAGGVPCIGDSPGVGSLKRVTEKSGVREVADQMGIRLVAFDESFDLKNDRGRVFKRFKIAKAFQEVDVIINLPKLKTHGQMILTLSVKNNFGFIVGKEKAKWHLKAGVDVNHFAQMLLDLCLLIQPGLTIMDGIIGMEGDGPGSGDPREIELIFAGIDCVAIDAVVSRVLGVKSDCVHTTRMARQMKIGQPDINGIEILGEELNEVKIDDFRLPRNGDLGFRIPKFLRHLIKNLITAKPLIDHRKCGLCRVCVDSCPPKSMKIVKERIRIDYKSCIRCFCCQELCPQGAIQIKSGIQKTA